MGVSCCMVASDAWALTGVVESDDREGLCASDAWAFTGVVESDDREGLCASDAWAFTGVVESDDREGLCASDAWAFTGVAANDLGCCISCIGMTSYRLSRCMCNPNDLPSLSTKSTACWQLFPTRITTALPLGFDIPSLPRLCESTQ